MFADLPSDIKKIIFNYNKIDYSFKCRKELNNFSNKLKYDNVVNELNSCFNEYIYCNMLNSVDDIDNYSIYNLIGYIIYNKLDWICIGWGDNIVNSGKINYIPQRLYNNMYMDVKSKINILS